jgi:putative tryptophan/tyrosine transport system substrate-binding protein
MVISDKIQKISVIILCAALGCAAFCADSFSADEKSVGIILSRSLGPYQEAVSGFKSELVLRNIDVRYKEFDLSASGADHAGLLAQIKSAVPDIILAVGTEASIFSRENIKDTPVVFSMVLNPVESGIALSLKKPDTNLTGVSLDIAITDQFELMKKIKPSLKKVGMLYGAESKNWLKDKASEAAGKTGLELLAVPVRLESEVLGDVEKVCSESDFLWAAADPMVYNAQSAQHILLITLRQRAPFMAFSANYVEAGALLALECDYRDIGAQAGQIAIKIMGGVSPQSIPVEPPRKTRLFINNRTAETIGLVMPKDLLDAADKVFGSH